MRILPHMHTPVLQVLVKSGAGWCGYTDTTCKTPPPMQTRSHTLYVSTGSTRATCCTVSATCIAADAACHMSDALDLACTTPRAGPLRPTAPHIRQHTCSIRPHTQARLRGSFWENVCARVTVRVDPPSPVVRDVTEGAGIISVTCELLGRC